MMMRRKLCAGALALVVLGAACGSDPTPEEQVLDALDGLENLEDFGDLENLENLEELEDLAEASEDILSGLSDGAVEGNITIQGQVWTLVGEFCFDEMGDLNMTGPALGPDGETAWFDVARVYDSREELEEFLEDDMVEILLNGKDAVEYVNVRLAVGQESLYSTAADDKPDWDASTEFGFTEIDWTLDGQRLSGSGTIIDENGVAAPTGEQVPFSFDARCI